MYGLGFENNPLGAENCMSSKFENLKLLDSLELVINVSFIIESGYVISNVSVQAEGKMGFDLGLRHCSALVLNW